METLGLRRLTSVTNFTELAKHKLEETSKLLGNTIAISDEDWQKPSLLPGWTRAHIAAHLAIHAENTMQLVRDARVAPPGYQLRMPRQSSEALERASERSALELQVALDTTAGQLNQCLQSICPSFTFETADGLTVSSDILTVLRLNETVLHHIDLGCGQTIDDVSQPVATWLLELNTLLPSVRQNAPAARIVSDSGIEAQVGPDRISAPTVTGPDNLLLGWLTGRMSQERMLELGAPPHDNLP